MYAARKSFILACVYLLQACNRHDWLLWCNRHDWLLWLLIIM